MTSAQVVSSVVKLEADSVPVQTPPDSPSQYVEENYDYDASSFSAVDFLNNSSYLNSDIIFADANGLNGRISNGVTPAEPQCRWTLEMIQCLIEQYRSHEEAFTGKHVFRRPIWMKITQEINNISTFPVTWLQCRQKWANLKRDAKARQKRVLGRNDDGSLPIQQGEVEDCINWDEVNDLASRGGQSGSKPGFSLFNEVERLMKLEEAAGISVPKKQQQQRQSLPAIMPPPDQQMMQIPSTLPNQPPSPSHVFTTIQQSSTIQEPSTVPLPQTVEQATALFNGGLAEPVQTQRVNRIAELLGRRKRKPAVSVSTLQRIANGFQPEKRPHQQQSPANSPSTSSEDSATLGVLQQIRDEMRSTRQDQREFLQTLMTESSIQAQAQADRDKTLISLLQGLLGTVNKAVGLITG